MIPYFSSYNSERIIPSIDPLSSSKFTKVIGLFFESFICLVELTRPTIVADEVFASRFDILWDLKSLISSLIASTGCPEI